jgi:IMP dehydrogenase
MQEALTYDDVLLVPQYSDIRSRSEIDLSTKIGCTLPIMSSPMDSVTESEMAIAMDKAGGLGIIHRYNEIDDQSWQVKKTSKQTKRVAAAVGISGDYLERASELIKNGCNILCLDVAHGHHVLMKEALYELKKNHNNITIIAGNIATPQGYLDLSNWGADIIRANIGGGSICTTRVQTGHGFPGLQTVFDCQHIRESFNLKTGIIADGGIRNSGDIVKALAAGADYVMVGSLLAGTDETPGTVMINPQTQVKYKIYRGMASKEAQKDWKGTYSSNEGVSSTVPYKGSVHDVLSDLERGIRSGLSYSGVRDIKQLQEKAIWIKQTNASQIESSPHILKR